MVVATDMQTDKANTRADAPSPGRASALAGMYTYAGNHRSMPCTLGPSRLNDIQTEQWHNTAMLECYVQQRDSFHSRGCVEV